VRRRNNSWTPIYGRCIRMSILRNFWEVRKNRFATKVCPFACSRHTSSAHCSLCNVLETMIFFGMIIDIVMIWELFIGKMENYNFHLFRVLLFLWVLITIISQSPCEVNYFGKTRFRYLRYLVQICCFVIENWQESR